MKGFIEVEYKGRGCVGKEHYIHSGGKILINIKQIQMIEDSVIHLAGGEAIYYITNCTYEEIKQKITHAQGELTETEKEQKIAYLKSEINYYSGLSKIDLLKNHAYEKIKEYEQQLKELENGQKMAHK